MPSLTGYRFSSGGDIAIVSTHQETTYGFVCYWINVSVAVAVGLVWAGVIGLVGRRGFSSRQELPVMRFNFLRSVWLISVADTMFLENTIAIGIAAECLGCLPPSLSGAVHVERQQNGDEELFRPIPYGVSYACLFWGPPRPPWPPCSATAARGPRTRLKKGPNRGPGWQGATRGVGRILFKKRRKWPSKITTANTEH
jgi:hypothetical protein